VKDWLVVLRRIVWLFCEGLVSCSTKDCLVVLWRIVLLFYEGLFGCSVKDWLVVIRRIVWLFCEGLVGCSMKDCFVVLWRIQRDTIINVYFCSCKVPVICHILMKLEFTRQIFEKYSNTKFHKNWPSGIWVVPCGRTDGWTDRHDKANIRSSKFLDRTNKSGAVFYDCTLVHGCKTPADSWLERLHF
jgi:hypothetical protein